MAKEDPYMKYFEMPKAILNMISESSPEGFLLFYIDNYGRPKIKADFSHQITEMGLRTYALKILESINQVEGSDITDTIYRRMNEENEDPEN